MADATLNEVRKYFAYDNASEFRKDWMALDKDSQAQLKAGIGNGTLTY